MKAKRRKKVEALANMYLECYEKIQNCGKALSSFPVIIDTQGATAIEAFDAIDTYGKQVPCKEPEKLQKILFGKAAVNLHIKIWAECVSEGADSPDRLRHAYPWLPSWVWMAVWKQAIKRVNGKRGYEFSPQQIKELEMRMEELLKKEGEEKSNGAKHKINSSG